MTFDELGLSAKVLEAISTAGYTEPTPIQAGAIPVAVTGRDVLGIAQTGTGKTASFVLPMLTRLERGRARARMPRSLILAPTRELAAQVAESFEQYGKGHKLNVALLIGGVSFGEQNKILDRGADVLIATPGRLLDHFGRGRLLMTGVEILVIDEADRMLDMGFIPDIEKICNLLPPRRQTLFFSATMPDEITRLVKTFLKDPERVEVARQSTTASTITQRFKFVDSDPREKRAELRKLIRGQEINNGIIFCNRKRDVAILLKSLTSHGFNAGALHGDMDQRSRMETLEAFRNGEITLLAASDVAARGLDIPEVSHVYNFDVPVQAEDYVHRIGRTGRAGREGYAATLVTCDDGRILKGIGEFSEGELEWIGDAPSEEDLTERKRGRGRGRGGKPSESKSSSTGSSSRGGRGNSSRSKPREERPAQAQSERDAKPAAEGGEDKPKRVRRPRRSSGDAEAPAADRKGTTDSGSDSNQRKPVAAKSDEERKPRNRGGERKSSSKPASGGRNGGRDKKDSVKGMGDHVPAFLARPVKG